MEFSLPDEVYKVCTGFNDAVRLHHPDDYSRFIEIPITSPRSGTVNTVAMFDQWGRVNVPDTRILAFIAGRTLTFFAPVRPVGDRAAHRDRRDPEDGTTPHMRSRVCPTMP